ncbi:MAG: hypothetical protein IPO32_13260 [Crocinitomicaceae bacterium]|nr:hypothetical protein [Crocinitomicaceae bacterium]
MKGLVLFLLLASVIFGNSFAASFPERCEGRWQGMMYIWSKGVLRDSVGIIFTVQPIATEVRAWTWTTEYISEKMPMTKAYKLIQKSELSNEFLLDEGDGVVLTNYVFENKMYSLFKVGKIWLSSSYEFLNESLVFEVTSGIKSKVESKGVLNFTFDFLQRVILKKNVNEKY